MAILNKIRQRSFFLIMVIALALFAFILSDLIRNSAFGGNNAQKVVGEVNGESIKTSEFQNLVESRKSRGSSLQIVKAIWNQKVDDMLLNQQVEESGIVVDKKHIAGKLEVALKNNATFQNKEGKFDKAVLNEYIADLKETQPLQYQNWMRYENNIEEVAAQDVFKQMSAVGTYTTLTEAKFAHEAENKKATISYVQIPYSKIEDKTIEITDADIKAYLKKHANEFQTEASTAISYVKIEEKASEEDEKQIVAKLKGLIKDSKQYSDLTKSTEDVLGFENTKEVAAFIEENSDLPYTNSYSFKNELNKDVASQLFDAALGKVYGPYKEKGFYKLAKLVTRSKIPDSVKASHILIGHNQTGRASSERTKEEAKVLADSILNVVKSNKSSFAVLAKKFSSDPSNKDKAGDLGYFTKNRMVKPFNDYVFENKKGDIAVVETGFGYHVVKIDDQKNFKKAVKIGVIAQEIQPSEATNNEIYAQATNFLSKAKDTGIETAAKTANLTVKTAKGLNQLDENITGIGKQREIVKWSFDAAKGSVKSFDVADGYIIATITDKVEKGLQSVAQAKDKVEPILINELKADKIIEGLKDITDLNQIAKQNGVAVKTATGVTLNNPTISGIGVEEKVVGTALGLAKDKLSKPIAANKGVYVLKVKTITEAQELGSYQTLANNETKKNRTNSRRALLKALKDNAEIVDLRAEIY